MTQLKLDGFALFNLPAPEADDTPIVSIEQMEHDVAAAERAGSVIAAAFMRSALERRRAHERTCRICGELVDLNSGTGACLACASQLPESEVML